MYPRQVLLAEGEVFTLKSSRLGSADGPGVEEWIGRDERVSKNGSRVEGRAVVDGMKQRLGC
jgi:hypothetical protein